MIHETPIYLAVMHQHANIVKLLLENDNLNVNSINIFLSNF